MKRVILFIVCVMLALSGCATPPWQISVIERVDDGLYRGPRTDCSTLKTMDVHTVVNLESDADAVSDEIRNCNELGIKVISVPLSESPFLPPSSSMLRDIADYLSYYRGSGVFVHCRRGIDRTSYAVAKYRIVYQGWDVNEAYDEALNHGHSEVYYILWKWSNALEGL